jgi:hypothetical protein
VIEKVDDKQCTVTYVVQVDLKVYTEEYKLKKGRY